MVEYLEAHWAPEVRVGEPGRLHALVVEWVAVVHLLLDRQYQNKAMEWDLGYADQGDGDVRRLEATNTGIVAKNLSTEFGGRQCLSWTRFAKPYVFVSMAKLRVHQTVFGQVPRCFYAQYNSTVPTSRFVPTDSEEFALLAPPTFRNRTVFSSSRNAAMCSTGTVDSILVPGLGFLVTWGVALRVARAEV